jgi:hypothetical protein
MPNTNNVHEVHLEVETSGEGVPDKRKRQQHQPKARLPKLAADGDTIKSPNSMLANCLLLFSNGSRDTRIEGVKRALQPTTPATKVDASLSHTG